MNTPTAQMSIEEMEKFSHKLAEWSASLSDHERSLFKFMLQQSWNRQSDPENFKRVFTRPFDIQQRSPKLTADFFKIMCW